MREDLRARGEGDVQVLNFGRGDFNFLNMYQYYRDFASTWDHDLALFIVENQDLYPLGQINKELYPVVAVEGDSLVIDYSFRESAEFARYQRIQPVVTNSAMFRMAFNTNKMIRRGELMGQLLGKFKEFIPMARDAKAGVSPLKGRTLPEVTLKILETLRQDPTVRIVLKRQMKPEVYEVLNETGLVTWDMAPVLQDMADRGIDPYYWPVSHKRGHWNRMAHAAIAEFLSEKVAEDPAWQTAP